MYAAILLIALGQVAQPPAPDPEFTQIPVTPPVTIPQVAPLPTPPQAPPPAQYQSPDAATATTEQLKVWLLTRMMVELSFNEERIAEFEKRLDGMSDRQVRMLIEFYKERVAKRDQAEAARQYYMQSQVLNQAKLDLMQAQGYKEHLQREHQQRILQGQMETNLVRQNIANQQFGRFGYGNNGFGGFGFGSPYPSPVYYGAGGGFY